MSDVFIPTPEPEANTPKPESAVADELNNAAPSDAVKSEPGEQPAENEAQDTDPESKELAEEKAKKAEETRGRISQLTARAKDAEARANSLERDLTATRQQLWEIHQRMNDPNATYDQVDHDRIRFALAEERHADLQRQAQRAAQEAGERRIDTFETKVSEFAERNPDFWESFAQIPVPSSVADLIVESDKAPEIAYYLAKNPAVARSVASLPPHLQGREIARIEGRLQAAPVVRKTSSAPPPPRTVGGQAQASAKDPAEMTDAEYSAWYRARQSKRA